MDMMIMVPSGKILLDGCAVRQSQGKLFITQNGRRRFLNEEELQMVQEMRNAFSPILDKEAEHLY